MKRLLAVFFALLAAVCCASAEGTGFVCEYFSVTLPAGYVVADEDTTRAFASAAAYDARADENMLVMFAQSNEAAISICACAPQQTDGQTLAESLARDFQSSLPDAQVGTVGEYPAGENNFFAFEMVFQDMRCAQYVLCGENSTLIITTCGMGAIETLQILASVNII